MTPEEEIKLSERLLLPFQETRSLSRMLEVFNEIFGQSPGDKPWWKREKEPQEASLEDFNKLLAYAKSTKSDDRIFDPKSGALVPNEERLRYLTDQYRQLVGGESAVIQEAQRGGFAGPTQREKALSYHSAYMRSLESYLAPVLAEINPPPEKEEVKPEEKQVAKAKEEPPALEEVKEPESKETPPTIIERLVAEAGKRLGELELGHPDESKVPPVAKQPSPPAPPAPPAPTAPPAPAAPVVTPPAPLPAAAALPPVPVVSQLSGPERRQKAIDDAIAAREKEIYEGPARRQKEIDEGIAARQKEIDEGIAARQKVIDEGITARQKDIDEGIASRQKDIDEGIASRQKVIDEGIASRQKVIDEGIAARQKEYDEGPARRQKEIDEGIAARQKVIDDGIAARQKEIDEGIAARQKEYDEGIAARQKEYEEGPARRQKEIDEGIAARQRVIDEGIAYRQKVIDEGIAARQKEYDEGIAARQKEYGITPEQTQLPTTQERQETQAKTTDKLPGDTKTRDEIPTEPTSTQIQHDYAQPQTPPPSARPPAVPSTTSVAVISSKSWNTAVRQIRTGSLPVSKETSIGSGGNLPQGRMPNAAPIVASYMRHPYLIQPVWNSQIELRGSEIPETRRSKGAWLLYIVPGFLNGHPPAIRMWNEDIPAGAQVWANDYGRKPFPPGPVQSVLLTDQFRPFLKCTNMMDTRSKVIPPPGCPAPIRTGEVPLFFRARGAKKPYALDFGDFLSNLLAQQDQDAVSQYLIRMINGETPAFVQRDTSKDNLPEGNRLLFQADIVMQVDRPKVVQRFEPDDINLLRYAGFDIELPLRNTYSARIYSVAQYTPPCPPTYWDIIFGTYIEYSWDELYMARFYLLSPTDDYREDGAPDGTWLPFVRHEVFWNLNYSSIQQIDVFTHDTSLEWFKSILSVLAGGVAWLFAVSVVNPIEAEYDKINTAMNQTAVKGQFWTG